MTDTVEKLKANAIAYQGNPARIQQTVLDHLDEVADGKYQVVDSTNPFVFSLSSAAVLASAAMEQSTNNLRRRYASLAQTVEDLYLHMSDRDYVERFDQPSNAQFSVLMAKQELLSRLVVDPDTGNKKMVIPRNTFFTIAETVFSLQYPVEIRQLTHGGLQIVYDVEKTSPLQTLSSNLVQWEVLNTGGVEWIRMWLDAKQFSIVSVNGDLTGAKTFQLSTTITDNFYYARVYYKDTLGKWVEMATTYSDRIYDVTQLTAVIKVVNKNITVTIPSVYSVAGGFNGSIRADIYETKGDITLDLGTFNLSSFAATWLSIDTSEDTEYVAALKNMRQIQVFSESVALGGKPALTFLELRDRVIRNATGSSVIPITGAQNETSLQRDGYEIIKNVDNITSRDFLATRNLPTPRNEKLITAAASTVQTLSTTIEKLIQLNSVVDNGNAVTITPHTRYKNEGGTMQLMSSAELQALLDLPPEKRALAVTNNDFYYTPFHYVLDLSNSVENEFNVRAYYLDAPVAPTKTFVAENDTTLLQVSVGQYSIERVASGYKLTVVTSSDDNVKDLEDDQLHVQLAYIPASEKDRAYLNGTLIGRNDDDERIYEFDLSTNFNVDYLDNLQLSKFLMYDDEPRLTGTPLQKDFDIIFSTSAVMDTQWRPNAVDVVLGRFLLPEQIAGLSHERIRIKFGDALTTLWTRGRTTVTSADYERHTVDVPRVYEKDILQRDANGLAVQVVNDEVQFTILHRKGDPQLDEDGNPRYLHRVGDVKLDAMGKPIIKNGRGLLREIDIMVLEGVYSFATDTAAAEYRTEMVETFLNWLLNDLSGIQKQLLDQSRIYLYPKSTLGSIKVKLPDNLVSVIPAGNAFRAELIVNSNVYEDAALKDQLTKSTIRGISEGLAQETVALSSIVANLRQTYGTDVVDVRLSPIGPGKNITALTVVDRSTRCSIRKRLVAQADASLVVEEDVDVVFLRHQVDS